MPGRTIMATIFAQRRNVRHLACLLRIHKDKSVGFRRPYSNGSFSMETELSIAEITRIIQKNEFTQEFSRGPVKAYESNQLGSNSPIEDVRSEASCLHTPGFLMGVFDGHAGGSCAQVISKRLLRYIGCSLVPPQKLRQLLANGARSDSFLQCHNDKVDFVSEIKNIYEESFARFAHELSKRDEVQTVLEAIENAALRLDQDLSDEALRNSNDPRILSVAMSGAVTCAIHIENNNLHVASTGDCAVVMGSLNESDQWVTRKLSASHSAENPVEVRRIRDEHPVSERNTVIRADRLLGQLAPLRAFGDVRYKWSREDLENIVEPYFGHCVAPAYHTPPYLTARPDVSHHVLTKRDRFLIIATDGLWDMMSPMQAVQLVGEHMSGKAFLKPLTLPKKSLSLGEIAKMLQIRRNGLSITPLDANVASHLIRNALGGTEYGVEHTKISHLLTLPQEIVRMFRDDITVSVVYLDQEFMRNATTPVV